MSIPNIITLCRIGMIPFIMYFMVGENYLTVIILLILAGITDLADGFVARKFNKVTKLGMVLDPIADKLMQFTVFVGLMINGLIPPWIVIVLFVKEMLMGVGLIILIKNKKPMIPANITGKTATLIFYATALTAFLLKSANYMFADVVVTVLAIIAVAAAFYAIYSYTRIFKKLFSEGKEVTEENE